MDDPVHDSFPPTTGWRQLSHLSTQLLARLGCYLGNLLASHCLLCGAASGNDPVCPACAGELPRLLPGDSCPCCGEGGSGGAVCGRCLRQPPPFRSTSAAWRYAFPADRLVQALKYQHRLALAGWLGRQLASSITVPDCDWIIPLPLHPERLAERGFNQSQLIAEALGKCLRRPVDRDSLVRIRPTPPQAALAYRRRQANVRGAFACQRDFRQQRLLLVDDVMTTGATLREAARVLRLHGASEIRLAVVARAQRDDRRILLRPDSMV
ncbi:ComF family protein [Dechloromonas sp. ZY10]|uniref:ComF family protein n=1 Tax=Dechloromonas aquae TaxID=2664436 RepID=UPI00352979DB